MKVLIYGFGAYKRYKNNISKDIIKNLKSRKGLHTCILPTVFTPRFIKNYIDKFKPDIVIGLGQSARAECIYIEKKAKNKMEPRKGDTSKIEDNGPSSILSSLVIPRLKGVRKSENAGTYLCNYTMYIVGRIAIAKGFKFTFIHIPRGYNLQQGTESIETILDNIYINS